MIKMLAQIENKAKMSLELKTARLKSKKVKMIIMKLLIIKITATNSRRLEEIHHLLKKH